MKINAEMLRGILDCMHAEADARDKHSAQIRSIVTAAKDKGFDTKAVRKVFVRERMDEAERAKQDDLLETYEGALGGKGRALVAIASGVPAGEAARANGVHRATVARAQRVAKQASNATPHDPATGEVIEDAAPQGDSFHLTALQAVNAVPAAPVTPAPDGGVGAGTHSLERGNAKPSRDGEASADERDASASSSPPNAEPSLSLYRRITGTFDEIAGEMPEKLRRSATVQP